MSKQHQDQLGHILAGHRRALQPFLLQNSPVTCTTKEVKAVGQIVFFDATLHPNMFASECTQVRDMKIKMDV